jgi:hypothetical protein
VQNKRDETLHYFSGHGFYLPIAERFLEPGEDELIVLERIFFSSSSGGTPETIGLLG